MYPQTPPMPAATDRYAENAHSTSHTQMKTGDEETPLQHL